MAEETPISEARVKYKGIFEFDDYYRILYDLFTAQGYMVDEVKYRQKEAPDGSREVEIIWKCIKDVDDYTRFLIEVTTFIVGMKEIPVQRGEMKTVATRGDIEIRMKSVLVTDYQDRWETSPFLKFLKGVYDRYIYRSTFEGYKDKVREEMYLVENEIKAFFNLSRFM
jgi:hypothetical protein